MQEIYRLPGNPYAEYIEKHRITNNGYHIDKDETYLFVDTIKDEKYLLKPVVRKNGICTISKYCEKCFFNKYILEGFTKCRVICTDYLGDTSYYFEEAPAYERLFFSLGDENEKDI